LSTRRAYTADENAGDGKKSSPSRSPRLWRIGARLTNVGIDLPLIWAVIILVAVMLYIMMDGYDLGIGLLFPFVPDKDGRDIMMNTVAPVWGRQ
jgi:hypothetical protein